MNTTVKLTDLSPQDFAHLGLQQIAFVKAVVTNGQVVYAIYAADGSELGVMPDRETAMAAARQHELEPLSVH